MVDVFHILLVNPACQDKRITDDDATIVPIGLFYIAALLQKNGFHTSILNLAAPEHNSQTDAEKRFSQHILETKPDLIGFSITNPSRMNAISCAEIIKKLSPRTPVVFGGPCATFLYDHLFEVCPALDIIIPGEGELSFLDLVRHVSKSGLKGLEHIPGLIYRKNGSIAKTAARPPVEDLDSLGHPARYFKFNHLSMSRGCPGKCTFCGSPKFWPNAQVRFHSPEWMIQEIRLLNQKGVTHFFISDDTFTMDKDRVLKLCRLIAQNSLQITWNAISRADYIDDDLLLEMRKAGCIQISFGVESGSSEIRKTLGKPMDQDVIIHAFRQTLAHGILPRAYFIYGSPGESDQTIQQSIDLMLTLSPLSAVFYMLVVFPGTHLYQFAKNKQKTDDAIWSQPIEDLPWYELDDRLDFSKVKAFGDKLRSAFYSNLHRFATQIQLLDRKELYPFHADFLSRLAMTFSHGEYANHEQVQDAEQTAQTLYKKALSWAPDARAFLGLGMLHQKKRNFIEAVNVLQKGLKHYDKHIDLNMCMGLCLMNMKQFNDALPYFEKIRTYTPVDRYISVCQDHLP